MWKSRSGKSEREGDDGRKKEKSRDDAKSSSSGRRRHRSDNDDTRSETTAASRRSDPERKRRHRDRDETSRERRADRKEPSTITRALNQNEEDDWEDDDDDARTERSTRTQKSNTSRYDDDRRSTTSRAIDADARRESDLRKSSEPSRRRSIDGKAGSANSRGKARSDDLALERRSERAMPGSFDQPVEDAVQEYTMSGALPLDSRVPNQFPGQMPDTYAPSAFEPNPHGAAADYYNDQGESVHAQPGHRASTPMMLHNPDTHLFTPSATANPIADTGSGSAADFYGGRISPVASTAPVANTEGPGTTPARPGKKPSRTSSGIAAAVTAAAVGGVIASNPLGRPLSSAMPPKPARHNSEPGFAPSGNVYTAPAAVTGKYNSPNTQSSNHTDLYTAAGAAALGAAAYGLSHAGSHDDRNPSTPSRPEIYQDGNMAQQYHEHRSPLAKFKDGLLNLISNPDDVRKMEAYTEYIGVCKHCFDPRSSPYDGPRRHHYHPRKRDSFDSLRRRISSDRLRRKSSGERIGMSSRIEKDSRYAGSDNRRREKGMSAADVAGLGALGVGAVATGAMLWGNGKDFDDTYSVKSGSRVETHNRRSSRSSSRERRRRPSYGVVGTGREEKTKYVTVRTKDGRTERRKVVSRSKSRSVSADRRRDRNSSSFGVGSAAAAVLGATTLAASQGRRSPQKGHESEKVFVRRHQGSRSRSRSSSPGLGEIFGFTSRDNRARRAQRRSPTRAVHTSSRRGSSPKGDEGLFSGFFAESKPRKHGGKQKKERGFFSFSNGSASSSDSELAFGEVPANRARLSHKSSRVSMRDGRKVNRRTSEERMKAAVAGISVTAAALAAAQKGQRITKRQSRPELGARRETCEIVDGRTVHGADNDGWEDELPSDATSASNHDAGLAFGEDVRRGRMSRQSMDSLASKTSEDGLAAWAWRWGAKKEKKRRPATQTSNSSTMYQPSNERIDYDTRQPEVRAHDRRVSQDHSGLSPQERRTSSRPMQTVDPRPMSDAGLSSRKSSMPGGFNTGDSPSYGRPGPAPLQHPQPIAPSTPSFTRDGAEDPMITNKLRRASTEPTRKDGSFMQDAALIGGVALATAGIIASQGRKTRANSNVRFGLTDDQQRKEEDARRVEKDREAAQERKRTERSRQLKEGAERARRESEERAKRDSDRKASETGERREEEQKKQREEERRAREQRERDEEDQMRRDAERKARDLRDREDLAQREREKERRARDTREREMAAAVAATAEAERRQASTRREAEAREAELQAKSRELAESRAKVQRDEEETERRFRARYEAEERARKEAEERDDRERERRRAAQRGDDQKSRSRDDPREDEKTRSSSGWQAPVAAGVAGAVVGSVLDGALRQEARESRDDSDLRHDEPSHSTRTVQPSNEHSGMPVQDDDLFDPNFFKRKRSQSEVNRTNEREADQFIAEHEAFHNAPTQSQAEFFAPPELLNRAADDKERSTDPMGGNEVQVWHAPEDEVRSHFEHPVYARSSAGPAHRGVPRLNVIAPTPPPSHSPRQSAQPSPTVEPRDKVPDEKSSKPNGKVRHDKSSERNDTEASTNERRQRAVSWGQDQTHVYIPQTPESIADRDSYISAHDLPASTPLLDEIVVEEDEEDGSSRTIRYDPKDLKKDRDESGNRSAHSTRNTQVQPWSQSPDVEETSRSEDLPRKVPNVPDYKQPFYDSVSNIGVVPESSNTVGAPSVLGWVEDEEVATPKTTEEARAASAVEEAEDEDWSHLSKKERKQREKLLKRSSLSEEITAEPEEIQPSEPSAEKREEPEEEYFTRPLSKKDKKKRDKAAKRSSTIDSVPSDDFADASPVQDDAYASPKQEPEDVSFTSKKGKKKASKRSSTMDSFSKDMVPDTAPAQNDADASPEQNDEEVFYTSKKDKKKAKKNANRQLVDTENDASTPSSEHDEPTSVKQERDAPETAPLSNQEKSRLGSLFGRGGFGSAVESVMTASGIAALAGATAQGEKTTKQPLPPTEIEEADPWEMPSKKDTKKKRKSKLGDSYDSDPRDVPTSPSDSAVQPKSAGGMPGSWDEEESSREETAGYGSDGVKDKAAEAPDAVDADDFWDEVPSKKSKKKGKRGSAFNEPSIGSPLRSELSRDEPKVQKQSNGYHDLNVDEPPITTDLPVSTTKAAKKQTDTEDYTGRDRSPDQRRSSSPETLRTDKELSRQDSDDADYDATSTRRKKRHSRYGAGDDDQASGTSRPESDVKESKGILGSIFGRKSSETTSDEVKSRPDGEDEDGDSDGGKRRRRRRRTGSDDDEDDSRSTTSGASRRHRRHDDAESSNKVSRSYRDRDPDKDDPDGQRSHHRRRSGNVERASEDQSFLGSRVEDLPPLPDSRPASPTPAAPEEGHDNGKSVPAGAIALGALTGAAILAAERPVHHKQETPTSLQQKQLDDLPPRPYSDDSALASPIEYYRPGLPVRPSSSTKVPLRFRPPPNSPQSHSRAGSLTSPIDAQKSPASATRSKTPRSRTTDTHSGEFKPLYLPERHSKAAEILNDDLPSLPSSKTTSRASSVHESEGYDTAAESIYASPSSGRSLRIDTSLGRGSHSDEDILDSQQTTPRAGGFDPSLESETKQEPQFYTWEDLMREQFRNEALESLISAGNDPSTHGSTADAEPASELLPAFKESELVYSTSHQAPLVSETALTRHENAEQSQHAEPYDLERSTDPSDFAHHHVSSPPVTSTSHVTNQQQAITDEVEPEPEPTYTYQTAASRKAAKKAAKLAKKNGQASVHDQVSVAGDAIQHVKPEAHAPEKVDVAEAVPLEVHCEPEIDAYEDVPVKEPIEFTFQQPKKKGKKGKKSKIIDDETDDSLDTAAALAGAGVAAAAAAGIIAATPLDDISHKSAGTNTLDEHTMSDKPHATHGHAELVAEHPVDASGSAEPLTITAERGRAESRTELTKHIEIPAKTELPGSDQPELEEHAKEEPDTALDVPFEDNFPKKLSKKDAKKAKKNKKAAAFLPWDEPAESSSTTGTQALPADALQPEQDHSGGVELTTSSRNVERSDQPRSEMEFDPAKSVLDQAPEAEEDDVFTPVKRAKKDKKTKKLGSVATSHEENSAKAEDLAEAQSLLTQSDKHIVDEQVIASNVSQLQQGVPGSTVEGAERQSQPDCSVPEYEPKIASVAEQEQARTALSIHAIPEEAEQPPVVEDEPESWSGGFSTKKSKKDKKKAKAKALMSTTDLAAEDAPVTTSAHNSREPSTQAGLEDRASTAATKHGRSVAAHNTTDDEHDIMDLDNLPALPLTDDTDLEVEKLTSAIPSTTVDHVSDVPARITSDVAEVNLGPVNAELEEPEVFITKKSKKDKRKAKKQTFDWFEEPQSEDISTHDLKHEPVKAAVDQPIETVTKTTQPVATNVPEPALFVMPAKLSKKEKREWKTKLTAAEDDIGLLKESSGPVLSEASRHTSTNEEAVQSNDLDFQDAVAKPLPKDMDLDWYNESVTQPTIMAHVDDLHRNASSPTQRAVSPSQKVPDLEFAATLAAGLAESGFDTDLVTRDTTYHNRDSPPQSEAEAIPYEAVFTAGKNKRKKGKGKQIQAGEDMESSRTATPKSLESGQENDFEAALSKGLAAGGFDSAVLQQAAASSDSAPAADEEEFSFAKPRKKKGKQAKQAAQEAVLDNKMQKSVGAAGFLPEAALNVGKEYSEQQTPFTTAGAEYTPHRDDLILNEDRAVDSVEQAQSTKPASDVVHTTEELNVAQLSNTDAFSTGAAELLGGGSEMSVDEQDMAYRAYKKNKRKAKKEKYALAQTNEAAPGEGRPTLHDSSDVREDASVSNQHSFDKSSAVAALGVATLGAALATSRMYAREPPAQFVTDSSRPAEEHAVTEPQASWSFSPLDGDDTSHDHKDESAGQDRQIVRDSGYQSIDTPVLTQQPDTPPGRSPLRVDIATDPDWTVQVSKQRQMTEPRGNEKVPRSRTPSGETPLEPTSRNRASYLFQSPPEVVRDPDDTMSPGYSRSIAHDPLSPEQYHDHRETATEESPSARLGLDTIMEESAGRKRGIDETRLDTAQHDSSVRRRLASPDVQHARHASEHQALRALRGSASPDLGQRRAVSSPLDARMLAGNESEVSRPGARRLASDNRSPSVLSNRSNGSIGLYRGPDEIRSFSRASSGSADTKNSHGMLKRTSMSGDLRAASRASLRGSGSAVGQRDSPKTIPFEPPPTPPSYEDEEPVSSAGRVRNMTDVFQGYGDQHESHSSPTRRPPSVRKRQSMAIIDLEARLEQLAAENRALSEARHGRGLHDNDQLQQVLEDRELRLREKDAELHRIQAMLHPMQIELNRLTEINEGLTEANRNLVDDTNGRYATIQAEHEHAHTQWQSATRELDDMRSKQTHLASNVKEAIAGELSAALAEKDREIRRLREELDIAVEQIKTLQAQVQSARSGDGLKYRDEDYLDGACQRLCQHAQQWVLRFSKVSDNRIARLSTELNDDKIEARLDNAILDGSDVDKLLVDRTRRRDVFMSVFTTMIWEYVFTRYLFGMDREQRQKLKSLEKTLSEVGPPRAVAQWRATTLTLLSKRPSFAEQCELDTEAVAHEIFAVLGALLPPPASAENQLIQSLTRVIKIAVDLSIEMRTQRAEYIMLPPLQPEFDNDGELVRKMYFNPQLMNERSGLYASNEALGEDRAVVKIVLFPPIVKKGDDFGEGAAEIVVCPAQVLVHNDGGKGKKVVRVMSGAMDIDDPQASKQSLVSMMPGQSVLS